MLPGPTLPESWRSLLATFRPAFRRRSMFAVFVVLATGLVAALYAPRAAAHRPARAPAAEGPPVGHPGRDRRHRRLAHGAGAPLRAHRHRRDRRDPQHLVPRLPSSDTAGRTVLARDPGETRMLAIFTTDTTSAPEAIVARYAHRWSVETAIAGGKQQLGIGQVRNRVQKAVERTAPFQFIVYSLVIVWYALHGYHRDDLATRRADQPWYTHKDEPAFEDMLAKLRRTLVADRITGVDPAQPDLDKYREYELACAATAA